MAKKQVSVRNMTRRINRARDKARAGFHINVSKLSEAAAVDLVEAEARRRGVIKDDEMVVPDNKAKAAKAGR